MPTIIENGTRRRCFDCSSIIEFTFEDLEWSGEKLVFKCPVCGAIFVDTFQKERE